MPGASPRLGLCKPGLGQIAVSNGLLHPEKKVTHTVCSVVGQISSHFRVCRSESEHVEGASHSGWQETHDASCCWKVLIKFLAGTLNSEQPATVVEGANDAAHREERLAREYCESLPFKVVRSLSSDSCIPVPCGFCAPAFQHAHAKTQRGRISTKVINKLATRTIDERGVKMT